MREPVLDTRANGIDVSKWDQVYNPVPGSVDFAVVRSSWGMNIDVKFRQHCEAVNNAGILLETYHYYHMDEPWLKQVELAIALAQEVGALRIWWDAEEDKWRNQFGRRFANESAEAVRYLQRAFPKSGLYCNRNIYYLMEHTIDYRWLAQQPLWLADPQYQMGIDDYINGKGEPYWRDFREFKRPRGTWTYWQTSFKGDPKRYGVSGKLAVDENVFNGSREDLLAYHGKSEPPKQTLKRVWNRINGRIRPR